MSTAPGPGPLPDGDEPEHDGEQVTPNPEPDEGDEHEPWDPGADMPPGTGDPGVPQQREGD